MKLPKPGLTEPEQLSLFEAGPDVARLRKTITRYTGARRAENTVRAYESDWRHFVTWCQDAGRKTMPASPETVAFYIAELLETHKIATAQRRVAAIKYKHLNARHASPTEDPDIVDLLSGARRQHGVKPAAKAAITPEQLSAMLSCLPKTPIGTRNRAILLLGFASGMRRSELIGLQVADVDILSKGARVRIGRSKTDQDGQGREIGIFRGKKVKTCPVEALRAWLKIRGRQRGPLFTNLSSNNSDNGPAPLSSTTIWRIVKDAAASIGLDPALYGAHSLRAGCVTAAIEAGTPESLVMQRTGHRSLQTVARYVRPASLWKTNPLAKAL